MYQLNIVPKNYSVKPLMLLIHCYKDAENLMSSIRTMQINVSQIKPGESRPVFIEGEPAILNAIFNVSLIDAPKTLSVKMLKEEKQTSRLSLLLSLDANASPELIEGQIALKTASGDSYYIPLFGRIID